MQRRLIAAAIAAAFLNPLSSPAAEDEAAVVVTASRFADADPRIPANISVITRKDIENSPAATLPDLLRTVAGINVRTLYGSMATDAAIDLRGFGDSAASNTLILLDGQRLNPIDSGGVEWSAIPKDAINRIEILRGSGSVLYGDRASGGVINIVTDKSDKPVATAAATIGSYGYRAADARVAGGNGSVYFNLSGHDARADGWRRNSESDQQSLAGRTGLRFTGGEGFVDFATFRDSSGTPGALFRGQYQNQPDMARFPFDHQSREGYRLRPGFALSLGSTLRLEGELGDSSTRYHGRNFNGSGNPSYRSDRTSDNVSATPRLRWNHGLAGMRSETVAGLDYYDGDVHNVTWSSFSGSNTQRAAQTSQAAYFQNTTGIAAALDLTVGGRSQRVHQQAEDFAAPMKSSANRSRSAWETGLTGRINDQLRVFGRAGRTFRFPNTDELFGFDPITYATIFRGDLLPQQGSIREAGGSWRAGNLLVQASVFRMDLADEIAYDGTTFTNVNLSPTRHQGAELEGRWQLAGNWHARLAYSHTEATFRGGANDGRTIPLVPRDKTALEAVWKGGGAGTWSVLVNHVGKQRYSGDAANVRELMPSYTIVDAQASWDLRQWTVAARVANLFNRRYASFAGYSTTYSDYYYYPADPRSMFVTARYKF